MVLLFVQASLVQILSESYISAMHLSLSVFVTDFVRKNTFVKIFLFFSYAYFQNVLTCLGGGICPPFLYILPLRLSAHDHQ